MDRRNQHRPPLMFLPFLFMLALMIAIWIGINGGQTYQTLALRAIETQRQLVKERVRFAIESLKKGDSGSAERAIKDAIQNAIPIEGGPSFAVVMVMREVLRHDRPDYAVLFLDQLTDQEDITWDPMFWATLAEAEEQAGNKEEAIPATKAAHARAEAILREIGKLSPVDKNRPTPEQDQTIQHLIQAGNYFSEIERIPDKSFQAMREAHRLWPESTLTQNALGYTLVNIAASPEDIEQGLILTRRAANAYPDSPLIRDSYGWALFRKGDLDGARRLLREAVDLDPDQPEIRYHLGMVYSKLGFTRQADIELSRALDLRPDYPDAAKAKAALSPIPQASATPAAAK